MISYTTSVPIVRAFATYTVRVEELNKTRFVLLTIYFNDIVGSLLMKKKFKSS